MTTPNDFLKSLAELDEPVISPVPPVAVKIGRSDALAAKILLWLAEELPEDSTFGDLDDVLDSAKWWHMFFGSALLAKKEKET